MSQEIQKNLEEFVSPKLRKKWYVDNWDLFDTVIEEIMAKDYPILYVAEYLVSQGNPFALKTIQKHVKEEITRRLSK
tara:strand:+ start:185 stop:415 length:231 start_codon:yes stop_codon:yes gene_type:complete